MNKQEEQLLVNKAQGGDREALGLLWDAITPKLFGYLINTLHNKNLAEDLLQSTWVKAIEALPKFEQRGIGISAWLFAIARNECRQHWRKGQKETKFDDGLVNILLTDKENRTEETILVEQLLNKLTEDDRELIRLRYLADLSPNDIAKILNINFVAVRVRLHRAIARARAIINS